MSEWISVDERLPDVCRKYASQDAEQSDYILLASEEQQYVTEGWLERRDGELLWRCYLGTPIYTISHWMPLPKPPQSE